MNPFDNLDFEGCELKQHEFNPWLDLKWGIVFPSSTLPKAWRLSKKDKMFEPLDCKEIVFKEKMAKIFHVMQTLPNGNQFRAITTTCTGLNGTFPSCVKPICKTINDTIEIGHFKVFPVEVMGTMTAKPNSFVKSIYFYNGKLFFLHVQWKNIHPIEGRIRIELAARFLILENKKQLDELIS